MSQKKVVQVQKRDGQIVDFIQEKITYAVFKALTATKEGGKKVAQNISEQVVALLNRRFKNSDIPKIEEVQNIIEEVLIMEGRAETAKSYILYREQHRRMREAVSAFDESIEMVDKYIQELDWQVKENANAAYSFQGLNHYVTSGVTKKYWLNKVYPKEIREAVKKGDLHIHDLSYLSTYCCGWDLYDLLLRGFGGVACKVESKPASHFQAALGQLVNFFFALQGESAGAQAVSSFDTLLAPFIRYDRLSYKEVKQSLQEFLFNMAIPTRVGFQCPFTNITLDIVPSASLANQPVIIGGQPQNENYGDFQEEMSILNKALYECMLDGDRNQRVFSFPIPTVNITNDFAWDDSNLDFLWDATAKYGTNYFANFIHSDMNPEDVRSMCCRLRLSNKELYKRGGGLFGSNPLTGSVGVVTVNLPRIGYLSKTKKEFLQRLGGTMDLAKKSLEIKRKSLENFIQRGLYPYSKYWLSGVYKMRGTYFSNHFSTIGLVGMNEALLNFIGKDIGTRAGKNLTGEVMDFMKNRLVKYQKETDNLYNLEASPAEGTSYRLALKDRQEFPDIIASGNKKSPYYTNSTQLPVNYTDDLFEALKLQDELQCKYNGGCIEKGNKVLTNKGLLNIERIVKNFKELKPIKALSYNKEKEISEWDNILEAVKVNVKKHDKIRIKGERKFDIVTSDWHPFFVLERIKINPSCPICHTTVGNVKGFAVHLKWSFLCREKYRAMNKYHVVEKRADELKRGDYILQNSCNLYSNKKSKLNNDLMWLIGFFIGDGCISKFMDNRGGNNLVKYKVRFFSEHKKTLKKTAKILNQYFGCQTKVIKNDKRSGQLREVVSSKRDVWQFLFKYGFKSGKKNDNIYIPEKVKNNINKKNVFAILSGLMDSDGHINKKQSDFEYYTVSDKLANDVLEMCVKAGIMINKSLKKVKRDNEMDIWRLRIPAYEMTKIKGNLSNNVAFSKIRNIFSNRLKRHLPVIRVKTTSKVNVKDNQFYDLMTEKNHNYLAGTNTLVFVHNTVLHLYLGEKVSDIQTTKSLVKKVFENFQLPYISLTPTFSVCPQHGYISGEHFYCPQCVVKQPCEVYSRVVGYYRPVQQFHVGKQVEFKDRKVFKIPKV